jgi:hypothetical protein
MAIPTKESGAMMLKMVLGKCNIRMEISTKELGVEGRKMDKENINTLRVRSTMVIF